MLLGSSKMITDYCFNDWNFLKLTTKKNIETLTIRFACKFGKENRYVKMLLTFFFSSEFSLA